MCVCGGGGVGGCGLGFPRPDVTSIFLLSVFYGIDAEVVRLWALPFTS